MSVDPPFVDPKTGKLDVDQLIFEAVPVGKLLAVFVAFALLPMLLAFLTGPPGPIGAVLTFLAQFILAVGGAIVLMYVIVRARQLGGD